MRFSSKTKFLSYLMLCVAKMPFIPPVSIAHSASGLTAKERSISRSSSNTATATKARDSREDKGGSVKERLTLNLRQLGKKSQPRSHLPTAKGVTRSEPHTKRKDRLLPSSQTDGSPASSSGESLSKSHSSVKGDPEVKLRATREEALSFTLTLTPEAVQLLQRRSSERRQRSAARHPEDAAGLPPGSAADSRRSGENASKRHQPATHRQNAASSTAAGRDGGAAELGDIRSIVKVSLLNERHKYDDVEYEEEGDGGVDERVVLKCTEWLRGLENTPVTAENSRNKTTSTVKSF